MKLLHKVKSIYHLMSIENPYAILGVKRNCTSDDLIDAYRKKAKLVHPNNGGSEELFNLVTICFKQVLKDVKQTQPHKEERVFSQPSKLLKADGKMDIDKFNKLFDEVRIHNPYDDGYGKLMEKSSKVRQEFEIPKVMDKYDKLEFNKMFDKMVENASVQDVPELDPPRPFVVGGAECEELGGDTVQDFSGACNDLLFSDYLKAHTQTGLINPRLVKSRQEFKTLDELIEHREDAKYKIEVNKLYLEQIASNASLNERLEQERLQRLATHDNRVKRQVDVIHTKLKP